jgi:hypothetical protein
MGIKNLPKVVNGRETWLAETKKTSYSVAGRAEIILVGRIGLEPTTSSMSTKRSSQLS